MSSRIRPGLLVKVSKPLFDDPTLPRWTPEMDAFDGRTFRVRTVEDNGWNVEVTLEEARNVVTYYRFAADWLEQVDGESFMGFCDACGGFRLHKRLCPRDPARDRIAA